jgi:hypothetical protein
VLAEVARIAAGTWGADVEACRARGTSDYDYGQQGGGYGGGYGGGFGGGYGEGGVQNVDAGGGVGHGIGGIAGACERDKEALCGGVLPGGGRTHKCMQEHWAQLSAECVQSDPSVHPNATAPTDGEGEAAGYGYGYAGGASFDNGGGGGGDGDIIVGIANACEQDKRAFCGDVLPGEGRTHKCMQEHWAQLSAECAANDRTLHPNATLDTARFATAFLGGEGR